MACASSSLIHTALASYILQIAIEFARIDSAMAAVARALLFGAVVCAAVIAVAAAADGEAAAAVVVGQAKCSDCSRKNMKAQDAFKGLQVAIKCKNGDGEYESKAVGDLDGDGAFSVPLAADDLNDAADCFAQLHSATSSTPCPGQEPSKIVPLSSTTDNGRNKANTFVAVGGKRMHYSSSAECTSAFLCDYFHKHPFFDYFHKKPQGPGPKPKPTPANGGGAGNGGGGAGNGGSAAPSPSPPAYH